MAPIPRRALGLALLITITLPTSAAAGVDVRPSEVAAPKSGAPAAGTVGLRFVTGGFTSALAVVNASDGSNRLFVVQQNGVVRTVVNGSITGTFANLSGLISSGGERGLLGFAFHPSFESNRKVYAYFTDPGGDIVISEFTANAGGTSVDAGTRDDILAIEHSSFSNHNGGQLMFGPDGNLYAFTGDGGGGGDPDENAQDLGSLLGKVLRLTVTGNGTYSNPSGNLSGEIWAYGLRNPFRASFDRATGDLWIGDVGQSAWEEINHVAAGAGGQNYGWDDCEGAHNFEGSGCPSGSGRTAPVAEYTLSGANCAVTGGFVYRGSLEPNLAGQYVYTDFCSGNLWTMPATGGSPTFHGSTGASIAGFGESESGELYAADLGGTLYQVVAPAFSDIIDSQFYYDILWIGQSGITSGCGSGRYCPDDAVNREQMASFLVRALGLPPTGTDFYTDDESSPHESDINRVAQAGIATGCGGGQYCPGQVVNREQMASFLVRAYGLPPTGTDFFTDDGGSIHQSDINRLAASGITGGCGGTNYCPLDPVTRGQMAAFLRRAEGG